MKRFGTVDGFVETSESSLKVGRLVANFEFISALLRYGTYDEYRFFCPSLEAQRLLIGRLSHILDRQELARVALDHQLELLTAMGRDSFAAFHSSDYFLYLPKLARLRAAHSAHPLPLSGPIHSLDGVGTLDHVAELLRAPLLPGDTVVCTSQEGRRAFHNMLTAVRASEVLPAGSQDPHLEVIPLGVPAAAFEPGDRAAGRSLLGLPEATVCFLYLGRIAIASKGDLGPLLYAFRIMLGALPEGTQARLVLAGSGGAAEWENLLGRIRDLGLTGLVELRSGVDDAQKALLLAGADVFVSPVDSLQETFGISVVEAMAAGLPVLGSDFDGYRDLIEEGVTGFRIPTVWGRPPQRLMNLAPILDYRLMALALGQTLALDLGILVERMLNLVQDRELRLRMGAAGRARARAWFAWDQIIPRYEALWAEAAERAKAAWPPLGASLPDPPATRIFDLFQGYPSSLLHEDDVLGLTGLTQAVLDGVLPMPAFYEELGALADPGQLRALVAALRAGPEAWGGCRRRLLQDTGLAADILDFLALWMLKWGLLTRQGRVRPQP